MYSKGNCTSNYSITLMPTFGNKNVHSAANDAYLKPPIHLQKNIFILLGWWIPR